VKNLFGCVPGKKKIQCHLRAGVNRHFFAQMLVDLYGIIRPRLNLVDAVTGMETDLPEMARDSEHGRELIQLGYEEDLDFCLQTNVSSSVPVFRKGSITLD
jgi:Uncharacterized conserved protein